MSQSLNSVIGQLQKMVYTYLVTGANRGIGLAIVEELAKKEGVKVIATARSPTKASELKKLAEETKKVEIVELDVSSRDSIDKLGPQLEKITPEGIDFLIGNAGVGSRYKRLIDVPYEEYLRVFDINLFGNILVFKVVYPFMLKKETRKVVFTSSGAGSLTKFKGLSQGVYGSSKATINYLTKNLAVDHAAENFTFVATHPGFVETDMTIPLMKTADPEKLKTDYTLLSCKESATALVKVYDSITSSDTGKFYNYDGSEYPF